MENVLHLISKAAPYVIVGIILLIIISKLFIILYRFRLKRFEKQIEELRNESKNTVVDLKAHIEVMGKKTHTEISELRSKLKDGKHVTNEDIEGLTLIASSDKLAEATDRMNQVKKSLDALSRSIKSFSESPFWKFIDYIGNSDNFHGRRQS